MPDAPPLTGYRVLDLAGPIGFHCLKLLADMGADVVKIEPPGGDPARLTPPFKDDLPHREASLYFLHYNTNKRGITLDLETRDGQEVFRRLIEGADVVVETMPPGRMDQLGMGYQALKALKSDIIVCSITPFGQSGPWRDYKGSDLVGLALGNTMVISGEPDQPPVQAPGELAYGMASTYGAYGIAVALYHRMMTGEGQYLEVSMHEASAHIAGYAIPNYSYNRVKPHRVSRKTDVVDLYDVYQAKDGYVRLFIIPPEQWRRLIEWIGEAADPISDPLFENMEWRRENTDLIHGIIADFVGQRTKLELYEEGQRRRIGVTPVNTPVEFVESAHTKDRGIFIHMEHPVVGRYKHYGPVPQFSGSPGQVVRTAPLVGEHNEEVYCGELGLERDDLMALAGSGVI